MLYSSINKLVIGFLAIAITVSAFVFILSPNSQSVKTEAPPKDTAKKEKEGVKIPKSAFVEPLPPLKENKISPGNNNLTEVLAQEFAARLLATNPSGPEMIEGELGVNAPNPDEMASALLENPDVYTILIAQESKLLTKRTDSKNVNVLKKPSQEDVLSYLNGLNAIMDGELLTDTVTKIIEQDPSPLTISLLDTTLQVALAKLDKLRVPSSLLELHVNMRDSLIGVSAILNAKVGNGNDPVFSLLALQKELGELQKSIDKLQEEAVKLPDKISSITPRGDLSWWQTILVKQALALAPAVPVADILNTTQHTTTSIATWGQIVGFIKEWAGDYLLETLKTHIITRLTQITLSWIKGGGQPRFVTNWRSFLEQTVNTAVGDVIYKLEPQMCSSFGQLIKLVLEPTPQFLESPVYCTLDQVIANIQDFYNDFNNGSWIAYTTALQPKNNILGALELTSDIAAVDSLLKREAAKSEVAAAQSYIGQKICSKWEWRTVTPTSTDQNGTPPLPTKQMHCLEYNTTTPGSTIGNTLNQALLAPVSRIVNAQTFTSLTTMFIDSALNKLLTARKDKHGGEVGLLGLEQSTSTLTFKLCEGFDGKLYKKCVEQVKKMCEEMGPELKQKCLGGIVEPQGGSGVCADYGTSVSDYSDELKAAIDDVINRNPNGIADALNTTENSFAFLEEVAESLRRAGLYATTDVKNGNDNSNTGDLIAIWGPGDTVAERYDAVEDAGAGNRTMREAATASQFTGDIPLSCVAGSSSSSGGGGGRGGGGSGGGGGGREFTSLLSDVEAERAKYGALLSEEEAGTILNTVAWNNRSSGWGLSGKTAGARCTSPAGEIACDILRHKPTNTIVDVFESGPGGDYPTAPARPVWSVLG